MEQYGPRLVHEPFEELFERLLAIYDVERV
jgi:hypothetical protein